MNDSSIIILSIIIIVIVIYVIYNNRIANEKRRKEIEYYEKIKDERKQSLINFIENNLDSIQYLIKEFDSYLSFGYFNNYKAKTWSNKVNELNLHNQLNSYSELLKSNDNYYNTVDQLLGKQKHIETIRDSYNKKFVESELLLNKDLFSYIEKRQLDIQQQTAIVTDEDNNLVIAGAGSGKTTTIVGKVIYLIQKYNISPNQFLIISFTKKSTESLKSRINIKNIDVKTFHKLGLDIITEGLGKKPTIFDESKFRPLIKKIFEEHLKDNRYLNVVTNYFSNLLKQPKSEFDFENQGEYIQYIKDNNFKSYKQKEIIKNGKKTYKQEVVKSIQECQIANFLFFNGIEYEYEKAYPYETADKDYRQYKPDFTIKQDDKELFIEHWGLTKDNKVPRWFANKGETLEQASNKYINKVWWARNLHENYNTKLIETYSYQMYDETFFVKLENELKEAGIKFMPKTDEEIWQIINNAATEEVDSFLTLITTFISLYKSNNFTIQDLLEKNISVKDKFTKARNEAFVKIIKPIIEKYQSHLNSINEIDFNDMINIATSLVTDNKYNKKIKYIIIDEFQDISIGRFKLINALIKINPDCKTFCVGDDWQSIYRFTGSDISLFRDFEKHFGVTVRSKIETTYRYNDPLISLSGDFIMKNPNQAKKNLQGFDSNLETQYSFVYSESEEQDDTKSIKNILDELINEDSEIQNKKIFIIGRYNNDINRIKNTNKTFIINEFDGNIEYNYNSIKLRIQYITAHKSKGDEADYIIVINCNAGKHGFPSEMSDDKVLNLLLSEADQFPNGEERRLFYVAMTRAKKKVYFVSDKYLKSKFINEIESETEILTKEIKKCPKCKTADLIYRSGQTNGRIWAFWGCSNYLFGCEYQDWIDLQK